MLLLSPLTFGLLTELHSVQTAIKAAEPSRRRGRRLRRLRRKTRPAADAERRTA